MDGKLGRRIFTAGGVFLLVIGAVHSLSLLKPLAAANDTERQLLDLMTNYKFDLAGSARSMMDLFRGFSIIFMVGAFGVGALDLAVSRERAGLLKRVAAVNVLWLAVQLAVSIRLFFIVPTSFLAIALLLFLIAWFALPAESKV